jgi:hypothetical protein
VACLIRRVQDLIVENGEVESETKTDWVCWRKVGLGNFGCVLISLQGLIGGFLSLVTNGELSEVSVIVSLPMIGQSGMELRQDEGSTNILW